MTVPSVHFPSLSSIVTRKPAVSRHPCDELAQVIEMVAGPILDGDGASIAACRAVAEGEVSLNEGQLARLRELLDVYVQHTHALQARTDLCWQAGDLQGVLDAAVDRTAMMPTIMHDLDRGVQAILDTP